MRESPGLFERQVAVYASYHTDPRNRLTHYFGVPMIAFSVLVLLELWTWGPVSLGVAVYLALAVL